jgi:hypothetical protein
MKRISLLVLLIFLWIFGCQTTERQFSSVREEDSVAASETAQKSQKRYVNAKLSSKSAIVSAVKYALGLEKRLIDNRSAFNSKEQVYKRYREGFAPELAKRLTEYSWAGNEIGLRASERTMEVPERVEVASIDADKAIAFFDTPQWLREMRGWQEFTVLILKKERGRWLIMEAKRSHSPPSP